jgi:iron complex outermembrane receptor protein
MKSTSDRVRLALVVCATLLVCLIPNLALAQETKAEEGEGVTEQLTVTGSRILRDPLNEPAPVLEFEKADLETAGLTNLGAILQQLPVTGSAINTRFNVPGNSGFPQDGNGIGAGAVQLSLRNLGAKRTLILVDGRRWIAGASASGVPSSVDINTIPSNAIKRVEVLQAGASAIYGSDAIGGVVNIITEQNYNGFKFDVQNSENLSYHDGEATQVSALWGGGSDKTHFTVSVSFEEERDVETWDRDASAFPSPYGTSCLDGGCSSFTPQARIVLGSAYDFTDVTLNDGVLNDGGANKPVWDPNNPTGGDFHAFSSADRFNYNGAGYNFLQTPNERVNIFMNATHKFTDTTRFIMKAVYTNRQSTTKGAPEPLCFGAGCGNAIAENIVIDADQIYNPFGFDLSVADNTLEFIGRRPLESGQRLYIQDVNSYFLSAVFQGELEAADRIFYWDVGASYGDNRGFQQKTGAHNMALLAVALGDPSVCAATPGCVPFNVFGGQGPDGNGSITQEMLDYIGFVQRDFSDQTQLDISGNITGDIANFDKGRIAFAAGFEYRENEGSFQPDPIAERGQTAGIASGSTKGEFDVTEYYGELSIPLTLERPGVDHIEFSLAGRSSDYSTFGSEETYKVGVLWRPMPDLSLRGSVSTGIRAPGIGELFGGAAREDFNFLDPCADVMAQIGSSNGGRDTAQSQTIIDNCASLGVPVDLAQLNPQLSAVSAGNEKLIAETSDNTTLGFVYSPKWSEEASWTQGITFSVDYYKTEIDDAIQGRDPGELISACVDTLDPFFCDAINRTSSGLINLVDNQLQNIGAIEASGYDVALRYIGTQSSLGRFDVVLDATFLDDYTELTPNPDGTFAVNDRTGTLTDETFFRAFPELRSTTNVNWVNNHWSAGLKFRFIDRLLLDSGSELGSVTYTDVRVSYRAPFRGSMIQVVLGSNNVLDKDPPSCDACGVINMSPVAHDLPGRNGYLKLSITM